MWCMMAHLFPPTPGHLEHHRSPPSCYICPHMNKTHTSHRRDHTHSRWTILFLSNCSVSVWASHVFCVSVWDFSGLFSSHSLHQTCSSAEANNLNDSYVWKKYLEGSLEESVFELFFLRASECEWKPPTDIYLFQWINLKLHSNIKYYGCHLVLSLVIIPVRAGCNCCGTLGKISFVVLSQTLTKCTCFVYCSIW